MSKRRSLGRQHWESVLAEYDRSGQSVAEFCRSREILPVTFYSWRKKLRPQPTHHTASNQFTELTLSPRSSDAWEVTGPGGITVRLPRSASAEQLRLAVDCLRAQPC
jgi:transposase-like protein